MALSGQLNDLSLPELIELFCNQNRTGRLKIFYPSGPGLFYFQSGALVDAKIGVLTGVEAFYYALTLENAMFKFNSERLAQRRTIHQPWTHVALEGLRRIDEGEIPKEAYPEDDTSYLDDPEYNEDDAPEVAEMAEAAKLAKEAKAASLSFQMMDDDAAAQGRKKAMLFGGIGAAAVLGIAALGIPAGWYSAKPKPQPPPVVSAPIEPTPAPDATTQATPPPALSTPAAKDQEALKRDVDKKKAEEEKKKAERDKKAESNAATQAASKPEPPKPTGPKTVTVQVTYDESGRVTGASGGDAAAVRIARQKRFPAGKAGTATVTIPVN